MNKYLLVVFMVINLLIGCSSCKNESGTDEPIPSGSYLGQKPPGIRPERFAQEIIGDNFYPHSKMTVSPKADRIYWTTFLNLESGETALYCSDFNGNNLSPAMKETELSAFGVLDFAFYNDGEKVFFGSTRPYDKMEGKSVNAVWVCEKGGSGWSTPQPIESTIDSNWAAVGSVSVNSRGDIYFTGRQEGGPAKIYCSKYVNGVYQNCEPLPDIINSGETLDPFIDSQDRFLLFAASNRTDNIGIIDLYVSFKNEAGNWQEPRNLGQSFSTPFLSRFPVVTSDGKYLFFVTAHGYYFPSAQTHFYWVDAKIIDDKK